MSTGPAPSREPLRLLLMASVRWYNANAAYAVEVARGLADRGHAVRLLVKPGSPVEEAARRHEVPVIAEEDLTRTGPRAVWRSLQRLRTLIRDFRPQVVNAHRSEDHLLAALALRRTGIPLVRTRSDIRPPRPTPGNRILYRRGTTAQVACADFMPARFYPPLGIAPETVHVIRPGVALPVMPLPEPAAAREELGLDPAARWIGLIGRFTAAKGHPVLLDAFARLRDSHPDLRLFLAGVENEVRVEDLRQRAGELGVGDRVLFRGRLEDVALGLRALEVLAVPSVSSEAISRIAMEGMALGIPVVAARTNSLPEIVGEAGELVPPGDAPSLAEGLRRMLDHGERRLQATVEGPARMRRRYDPAVRIDLTEALFRELLAGSARG